MNVLTSTVYKELAVLDRFICKSQLQQSLDELKAVEWHDTRHVACMPTGMQDSAQKRSGLPPAGVILCCCEHGGFDDMHACMHAALLSQHRFKSTAQLPYWYSSWSSSTQRVQEIWGGQTGRSWWNLKELADDA